MDRNYIDRYLVVDRYVAGDLTQSESDEFEDRLVWDKELVEEVDIASQLREGLQAVAADTEEPQPVNRAPTTGFLGAGRLALAASFVAGALGTSLVINQMAVTVPDGNMPTQVVALELLRSTTGQEIAVGSGGMTVLMVSVDGSSSSYDVELVSADVADPIWTQSGLVPGYTMSLAVGINNQQIRPGRYSLRVYAEIEGDRTLIQEIPFTSVTSE